MMATQQAMLFHGLSSRLLASFILAAACEPPDGPPRDNPPGTQLRDGIPSTPADEMVAPARIVVVQPELVASEEGLKATVHVDAPAEGFFDSELGTVTKLEDPAGTYEISFQPADAELAMHLPVCFEAHAYSGQGGDPPWSHNEPLCITFSETTGFQLNHRAEMQELLNAGALPGAPPEIIEEALSIVGAEAGPVRVVDAVEVPAEVLDDENDSI